MPARAGYRTGVLGGWRTAAPAALAVVVLASVAVVAAHVPRPDDITRAAPSGAPVATPLGASTAQAVSSNPVSWWLFPLGVAGLLVVVGPLVWFAVRHGLGRRRDGSDPGDTPVGVDDRHDADGLTAADTALADAHAALAAGGDPREVVIACWVRLEAAAEAAGQGRRPAETATDVARRWLGAGAGADRAAVDTLAALFHEARYSTHPVTDEQRARARAALAGVLGSRV